MDTQGSLATGHGTRSLHCRIQPSPAYTKTRNDRSAVALRDPWHGIMHRPDQCHSVHELGADEDQLTSELEPVSGFEPLTCRLQEVRPPAPCALAALTAHIIALTALAALGLSRAPFHETFHADGIQ
jgi:hypothetical protein